MFGSKLIDFIALIFLLVGEVFLIVTFKETLNYRLAMFNVSFLLVSQMISIKVNMLEERIKKENKKETLIHSANIKGE
jgi:hypothetical protein